jgi:DNA gyrase subunit A
MATNMPPHNLSEVADAIVYMIDNWERHNEIGLEELMQFVKGPDFPTGGIILGLEGIRRPMPLAAAQRPGARQTSIEEARGRFAIIVTEIPYQVNKSNLIERMAELVREGRLDRSATSATNRTARECASSSN